MTWTGNQSPNRKPIDIDIDIDILVYWSIHRSPSGTTKPPPPPRTVSSKSPPAEVAKSSTQSSDSYEMMRSHSQSSTLESSKFSDTTGLYQYPRRIFAVSKRKSLCAILHEKCSLGAHLPLGREPASGYTTEVCYAWPVRYQTYGYLPSRRASLLLDWYQRHVCMNNLPWIDEIAHSFFGKVTSKKVKNVKNAFFEMWKKRKIRIRRLSGRG